MSIMNQYVKTSADKKEEVRYNKDSSLFVRMGAIIRKLERSLPVKNKHFSRYYLLASLGVLAASFYPLYMGTKVVWDMIANGTVMKEDYPKYIIPYTPICVAVLIGILLMPLFVKLFRKYALIGGAAVSISAFFGLEMLFERNVVVTTAETVTKLEDWQMYMCYMPPEGWGETVTTYKTQTPVDILMGNYNPAFKLHFYIISVVLILAALNCLYGFGQIIKSGETRRMKALILQSVSALIFLGLCILACFTAFWRDGSILVSPLSAALMSAFFVLLGVTAGIFAGSFLIGQGKRAMVIPSIVSGLMTLLMYFGEMVLLHGHLYQYGTGFFFRSLPVIVLAPVDICLVFLSGVISAGIFYRLNKSVSQLNNLI